MKNIVISFALLMAHFGQSQIQGTVKDLKGKPLPYVNIFIENTYKGTTSNEDGQYELNISKPSNYVIVFQFLGYKTLTKELKIESLPHRLDVVMEEEIIDLKEVVIDSQENPANRIIRAAIAKRKFYLEKLDAFTADFYSKGVIRIVDAPEKFMGQELGDFDGALDSTRTGILYLSLVHLVDQMLMIHLLHHLKPLLECVQAVINNQLFLLPTTDKPHSTLM